MRHLKEDLAQEARIAAWLAEQSGGNKSYVKMRSKMAQIDFMRKWNGRYNKAVLVEFDDHAFFTWEPRDKPDVDRADLALLKLVVRFPNKLVAAEMGVTEPTMSKRLKKVRDRVEKTL